MSDKNATIVDHVTDLPGIERRTLLKGMGSVVAAGLVGSGLASPGSASAQQNVSGLSNRSFSQEALNGKPWVYDGDHNFDFEDPVGNRMASMKITNNLIGEKTYVAMFSRVLLGPQGKPGAPLHGHIGLWTWQLQEPDPEEFPDAEPGSIVQRALFTGMILDPYTYKPVDSVKNHYTGKDVEVKDSVFAETYVLKPKGGHESIDRPEFMTTKRKSLNPHVIWGDEISLYLAGIFQNEGPNQPRMDSSVWTTSYADFKNPDKQLLRTDYNFAGLMRAWERPWIGIGKDDDAQLLWNVKGTKLHDPNQIPGLVADNILKKYPDRI
ncbi:MAG: hypothetical protein AAF736_13765 [Pseudomonadota bacterium]